LTIETHVAANGKAHESQINVNGYLTNETHVAANGKAHESQINVNGYLTNETHVAANGKPLIDQAQPAIIKVNDQTPTLMGEKNTEGSKNYLTYESGLSQGQELSQTRKASPVKQKTTTGYTKHDRQTVPAYKNLNSSATSDQLKFFQEGSTQSEYQSIQTSSAKRLLETEIQTIPMPQQKSESSAEKYFTSEIGPGSHYKDQLRSNIDQCLMIQRQTAATYGVKTEGALCRISQ
jgi:flavodoxin